MSAFLSAVYSHGVTVNAAGKRYVVLPVNEQWSHGATLAQQRPRLPQIPPLDSYMPYGTTQVRTYSTDLNGIGEFAQQVATAGRTLVLGVVALALPFVAAFGTAKFAGKKWAGVGAMAGIAGSLYLMLYSTARAVDAAKG